VGHRKGLHRDRVDRDRGVRFDDAHQHRGKIGRQPLRRAAREIDRDRITLGETRHAAHVVVVLVGHQDAGEIARSEAHALEAQLGLRDRETAVHHHPRAVALDDQRVAGAAAARAR
jgi:hypothetical protein